MVDHWVKDCIFLHTQYHESIPPMRHYFPGLSYPVGTVCLRLIVNQWALTVKKNPGSFLRSGQPKKSRVVIFRLLKYTYLAYILVNPKKRNPRSLEDQTIKHWVSQPSHLTNLHHK